MLRVLAATTSADRVIDVFFNALGTPGGVFALFLICVTVIVALMRPNLKWLLISILLWVCTLAYPNSLGTSTNRLLPVFQQIRALNRGVAALLLLTLLCSVLGARRMWRTRTLSAAAVCFFVFEMFFAARMIGAADTTRGVVAAIIFVLTFAVLGVRLGRWLIDWADVDGLVRGLAGAGALLALGILPHVIVSRSEVVMGSRLIGTTANPQHLAAHLALSLLPCCYLLFRPAEPKWLRALLIPIVGLLTGFLLWTGSRTGFLMAAVGLVMLFRKSLGRFFIAAVFLLAAISAFLAFFPESALAAMRITDTQDTRSQVWYALLNGFESHPIIGTMTDNLVGVGENSYLATAAYLGMVGLTPLLVFLVATGITTFNVLRCRPKLGEHQSLADLFVAGIASILVGAFFEAYFLEVIGFEVLMLYAYFSIANFLIDAADKSMVESLATHAQGEQWNAETGSSYLEPASPPEFIL